EIATSQYAYRRDDKRQSGPGNALPAASTGGPGTLAQGDGTGWTSLALKATWRPAPAPGASGSTHVVDMGYQRDAYRLRYSVHELPGNYRADATSAGNLTSAVRGNTLLQGLYAQDTWQMAPDWKAVLGLRA